MSSYSRSEFFEVFDKVSAGCVSTNLSFLVHDSLITLPLYGGLMKAEWLCALIDVPIL